MPVIEHILSLHRKRESLGNDTIDLAYITPQFIATSMPASTWWKSQLHTPSASLRQYLDLKHDGFWRIWNLQEPSEIAYEKGDFNDNVVYRPMKDHTAPSFEDLVEVVQEIRDYVKDDSRNVAVVHCKRGQGRTGTVACAFLQLHHGFSAGQAIAKFTETRNHSWFMRGVSITSQRRYLRYIEKWQKAGMPPLADLRKQQVFIKSITLLNARYQDIQMEVTGNQSTSIKQNHDAKGETELADEFLRSRDSVGMVDGPEAPVQMSPGLSQDWEMSVDEIIEPGKETGPLTVKFVPASNNQYECSFDITIAFKRTVTLKQISLPTSQAAGCFSAVLETLNMAGQGKTPRSSGFSLRSKFRFGSGETEKITEWQWSDLDGFMGSFIRGPKLFDSLKVEWSTNAPE